MKGISTQKLRDELMMIPEMANEVEEGKEGDISPTVRATALASNPTPDIVVGLTAMKQMQEEENGDMTRREKRE